MYSVWRGCAVCGMPACDYNDYYYHVKDSHPEAGCTEDVLKKYVGTIREEYFASAERQAQPWEWMTGEPIYLPELQKMFGIDSTVAQMKDGYDLVIDVPPETNFLDALTRLRVPAFTMPFHEHRHKDFHHQPKSLRWMRKSWSWI